MSTHIFDFLKLNNNLAMLTGTITSPNYDMHLVPTANQSVNVDLSGNGNLKMNSQSGLSKTCFISRSSLSAVNGTNTLPICRALINSNACGGLKINTLISDANNNVKRFDDFIGFAQGSNVLPLMQQLSTIGSYTSPQSSSISAGSATNSSFTFTYSFPYPNNETVNVAAWIEWYGTASVNLGSP